MSIPVKNITQSVLEGFEDNGQIRPGTRSVDILEALFTALEAHVPLAAPARPQVREATVRVCLMDHAWAYTDEVARERGWNDDPAKYVFEELTELIGDEIVSITVMDAGRLRDISDEEAERLSVDTPQRRQISPAVLETTRAEVEADSGVDAAGPWVRPLRCPDCGMSAR